MLGSKNLITSKVDKFFYNKAISKLLIKAKVGPSSRANCWNSRACSWVLLSSPGILIPGGPGDDCSLINKGDTRLDHAKKPPGMEDTSTIWELAVYFTGKLGISCYFIKANGCAQEMV